MGMRERGDFGGAEERSEKVGGFVLTKGCDSFVWRLLDENRTKVIEIL